MLRLVKPADFFRAVSQSTRLKFTLAWVTFGGLVVPTALLMSAGISERYALTLMLAALLPFQYAVFCVLQGLRDVGRTRVDTQYLGEFLVVSEYFASSLAAYLSSQKPLLEEELRRLEAQTWKARSELLVPTWKARWEPTGTQAAVTLETHRSLIPSYPSAHREPPEGYQSLILKSFDRAHAQTIYRNALIHVQRAALELQKEAVLTQDPAKRLPSLLAEARMAGSEELAKS